MICLPSHLWQFNSQILGDHKHALRTYFFNQHCPQPGYLDYLNSQLLTREGVPFSFLAGFPLLNITNNVPFDQYLQESRLELQKNSFSSKTSRQSETAF